MATLPRNIAANFLGRVWSALMALLFVPLYVRYLGVEAYGLVGVFATLQASLVVLDLGINTALSRELARYSASGDSRGEARNLVRTLEVVYWGVAVLIALGVTALSLPLATHWLNLGRLSPGTVRQAIVLMGIVMAVQWPFAFYSGGLVGLQRQGEFNVILAAAATVRGVGALAVLARVAPTIQAYFTWQIVVSGLQTAVTAACLWRALRLEGHVPAFRAASLKGIRRFSAGVAVITVLALALTQTDKVLLSKLLSLEAFGYYTLAAVVSGGLNSLIGPVYTAAFPQFSYLIASGDRDALARTYHRTAQLMSAIILPTALILCFFAPQLLMTWTRNATIVERTQTLVVLLVTGTAMNGLVNVPYALQLAHGWTRLTIVSNLVGVALLIPGMFVAVQHYGAPGAAAMWVALNFGYVVITVPLMHRRLLTGQWRHWAISDVGLPFGAAVLIVGAVRLLLGPQLPPPLLLVPALLVTFAAGFGAAVVASTDLRWWIRQRGAMAGAVLR